MGVANGFVLTFTNGLKVYLTGDTGLTSDMKTVVRGFYGAQLVVFNIGDIFTTGPEEAAFAVTKLIQPNAVIPSHANEVATTGGSVNPGTRTERFIELVGDIPVFVPLSGVTMEFDGTASGLKARVGIGPRISFDSEREELSRETSPMKLRPMPFEIPNMGFRPYLESHQ